MSESKTAATAAGDSALKLVSVLHTTVHNQLFKAKRGKRTVVIKRIRDDLDDRTKQKATEIMINEQNVLQSLMKMECKAALLYPLRKVSQEQILQAGLEFPYVSRGDLFDMIERRHLSEDELRTLLGPVARALASLHENRFAHRDVKPENILVDADGQTYLCDFAFAKQYNSLQSFESDSDGTLEYFAPEGLKGRFNPFAADVWSLGIVLLNTASSSYAYEEHGDECYMSLHAALAKNSLPSAYAALSKPLRDMVCGMLHMDPAKRSTMKQVVEHEWWRKG